jgi:hypothetical protein
MCSLKCSMKTWCFFFTPTTDWRGLLEPEWRTLYYAVEVKKLVNHKLFYE